MEFQWSQIMLHHTHTIPGVLGETYDNAGAMKDKRRAWHYNWMNYERPAGGTHPSLVHHDLEPKQPASLGQSTSRMLWATDAAEGPA